MSFLKSYISPFTDAVWKAPETATVDENEEQILAKSEEEKLASPDTGVEKTDNQTGYLGWIGGSLWQDMKRDFVEVAKAAQVESSTNSATTAAGSLLSRTTASVRQQLTNVASTAANTLNSISVQLETEDDIKQPQDDSTAFVNEQQSGGETPKKSEENSPNENDDDTIEIDIDKAVTKAASHIQYGFSSVMDVMNRGIETIGGSNSLLLLGGGILPHNEQEEFFRLTASSFESCEGNESQESEKRKARLQLIRADPATYGCVPPDPTPDSGLLNYNDWRAGYFDEETCQPRPGVPLPCTTLGGVDKNNYKFQTANTVELEPRHLTPAELLKKFPVMRKHLQHFVNPYKKSGLIENISDEASKTSEANSLTDGDFWSRYYYHVWLLEVEEARRRRLAERMAATRAALGNTATGKIEENNSEHEEQEGWLNQLTPMEANNLASKILAKASANASAALNQFGKSAFGTDWDDDDEEDDVETGDDPNQPNEAIDDTNKAENTSTEPLDLEEMYNSQANESEIRKKSLTDSPDSIRTSTTGDTENGNSTMSMVMVNRLGDAEDAIETRTNNEDGSVHSASVSGLVSADTSRVSSVKGDDDDAEEIDEEPNQRNEDTEEFVRKKRESTVEPALSVLDNTIENKDLSDVTATLSINEPVQDDSHGLEVTQVKNKKVKPKRSNKNKANKKSTFLTCSDEEETNDKKGDKSTNQKTPKLSESEDISADKNPYKPTNSAVVDDSQSCETTTEDEDWINWS